MSVIQTYLAANAAYLDKNSSAAISGLPESAWPALVEAVGVIHDGATKPGVDCWMATTHETLADMDHARARHWSERGARKDLTLAGMPAVHYDRFQLRRGTERRSQVVIDLGDRRVSLYL